MVEVTQEDRELFVELTDPSKAITPRVLAGVWDTLPGMQAIAAHRIAAEKRARREGMERAVEIADDMLVEKAPEFEAPDQAQNPETYGFGSACVLIAQSIRSEMGETHD